MGYAEDQAEGGTRMNDENPRMVLVTGCSGHLGRRVVEILSWEGAVKMTVATFLENNKSAFAH